MFKYLFQCLFRDGSTVKQTQEDKSISVEGKNAFFDVLSRLSEVRAFALYNTETNDEYLVNLDDGHFEVNRRSFRICDEEQLINFRLIFFKRTTILVNLGGRNDNKRIEYHFGWQANRPDGSNVKRIIILN